jgi:dimethylamine monooxygenase subunit A
MVVHSNLTDAQLHEFSPDPAVYLARQEVPEWLDELGLKPAPPTFAMGMHSLSDANSLIVDDAFAMEVALRRRLMADQRDVVFGCLPTANAAAVETLELVRSWLRERNLPITEIDDHPLAVAGQSIPDDLCLMVRHADGWRLDAACLCFPSIWRLSDKFGLPMGTIHDLVPHYANELESKVDRFFDGLKPNRPVSRRNLSVKPFPLLHLPVTKLSQPIGSLVPDENGHPFWLRTEFQTLRRLPKSDAILFTIKLQIAPASVLLHKPKIAWQLAEMFRSWDAPTRGYKLGTNDLTTGFLPWLDNIR